MEMVKERKIVYNAEVTKRFGYDFPPDFELVK